MENKLIKHLVNLKSFSQCRSSGTLKHDCLMQMMFMNRNIWRAI